MRSEREIMILRYIEEHDFLSTEEAVEMLHTSAATVRRDFNELAERNTVRRVKGGVRRIPPEANRAIPLTLRHQWFSQEKALIAERAMRLIAPDSTIFVHGGSTTVFVARHLNSGGVITNSVELCEVLRERFPNGNGPEVILAGGRLDLKDGNLLGTRAEHSLAQYRADAAIFSVRGLDEEGTLDTSDDTAAASRTMIEHARVAIMLADHSKFQSAGIARGVFWGQIDVLVTSDIRANAPMLEHIARQGVEVIRVKVPGME